MFCDVLQRKVFIRTAKVFPLINLFGWKLNPQIYRRVVGVTEVIGGILLAIVPGKHAVATNLSNAIFCCDLNEHSAQWINLRTYSILA